MAADRAQRLSARRRAKAALAELRRLVRVLSEWERLEDADAIGVVRIAPGETEGQYGPDLLDLVAQAVSEAGRTTIVEVFVISSQESTHRPPEGHRRQLWQESTGADSTPTPRQRSAKVL